MSRYSTSGIEGQYEPGSDEQVLENLLGITDPEEMDEIELELLDQLYESVFDDVKEDQSLTVSDLKKWHRMWLGNVYGWAGEERSVNMSKPVLPLQRLYKYLSYSRVLNRIFWKDIRHALGLQKTSLWKPLLQFMLSLF